VTRKHDILLQLGELALATRLRRLADRLSQDVGSIYKEEGFDFDPRWFALLRLLEEEKSCSIVDISLSLGITHPAVVQVSDELYKKGLIHTIKDKKDKRRRILSLSDKGKKLLCDLAPLLKDIELANQEFLSGTGFDVLGLLSVMESGLAQKSMYERVRKRSQERHLSAIRIEPYRHQLKKDFQRLNEEWLKKYFTVEAEDKKIFRDPAKEILAKDGEIFFAMEGKRALGTCAVFRHQPGVYELAKMAVTAKAQGKQLGKKLALAAIAYAKGRQAKMMVLETNHKLTPALELYRQLGFVPEPDLPESKFNRCTVKMKLKLK
jgi:DNA-binding MarR family transcriptional regulator/N-acetylglutamate synthase-like GNAT family acetyltransferase